MSRTSQRGFVLTIEFIVISTILVIGIFVGVAALRDSLIKQSQRQVTDRMLVADANGQVLGPVVAFDEHEAPLVPYIDRTQPPDSRGVVRNQRILIGIRDDRFTSREPIYYTGENCTGTPCIKSRSDEYADSLDIAGDNRAGAVSYSLAQQNLLNYGIGRSKAGVQGDLFRESANSCPGNGAEIRSRYVSQKVVAGQPCELIEQVSSEPQPTGKFVVVGEADTACLVGTSLSDPLGVLPPACSCPEGYAQQDAALDAAGDEIQVALDIGYDELKGGVIKRLAPPVDVGTVCCPAGSTLAGQTLPNTVAFFVIENQLSVGNVKPKDLVKSIDALNEALAPEPLVCVEEVYEPGGEPISPLVNLKIAEPVPSGEDHADRTLERFTAPFRIDTPADGIGTGDWYHIPPDGEG